MKLNPYLFFDGDCEAAFMYYAQCLGGKIEMLVRHKGSPAESQVPPEWLDKVMHVRLVIGDNILMASDAPPGHFHRPAGFSVSLAVSRPAEAERLFHALAKDGTVNMPIEKTFWAERFGMLTDRFGIPWMINCEQAA